MAFHIITDSASDLPRDIINAYHVKVIPTPVVINDFNYLDGENLMPKEFYRLQADPKNDIKTFHINSYMFQEAFTPYAQNGDEVLYLCFSTGIAGTYNAANIAKEDVLEEYPDFKITIVDSKCASIGFGLLVYKLLKMQKNGAPKESVIEAAYFYSNHLRHIFTVETLYYLIKGGRLGKFSGNVGETLNLKPIIKVDEQGSLKSLRLVRGRNASLRALLQYVGENGVNLENQTLAVCHGDDEATKDRIVEELQEKYHPREIITSMVGCAIGAHTGKGIVGICFVDTLETPYEKWLF